MKIKYPVTGYIYVNIPDKLAKQKDEDGCEDLTNAEYYAENEAEDLTGLVDEVRTEDGSHISIDVETGRYEIIR